MIKQANWIASPASSEMAADFQKAFVLTKPVKKATPQWETTRRASTVCA